MSASAFFHIDLATILNLVSTIAIVGALIFTALQVRQGNRSQRNQAAVAMMKTVLGGNLGREMKILGSLPMDAKPADIEHGGPEIESALGEFGVRMESIGYMVFLRILPLEMVDELMGGLTLLFWSRAKAWVERERTRTGNPKFYEWCEWLADRIGERRRAQRGHMPAHQLHAVWRE